MFPGINDVRCFAGGGCRAARDLQGNIGEYFPAPTTRSHLAGGGCRVASAQNWNFSPSWMMR
jgi:hypothetical protein